MKKRLLAGLLASLMAISMMATTAFAAEVESTDIEVEQTLDVVFDYLNNQEILLGPQDSVEYEIPVGENLVSVTIENTPIAPYGIVLEDNYYDVEWGVSYINTTTINNFHSNSGKIVFKVYYYCWGNDEPGKVRYRLTPTDVTMDVTDPSGCTLIDSSAWYDPAWTISGAIFAYGNAEFDRIWPLSNYVFDLKVSIISYDEGYVLVRYQYET